MKNSNINPHWQEIIDIIVTEGEDIHKVYSIEGELCFLTDRTGYRYKITPEVSKERVRSIITDIRKTNNRRK